jgi:hypothetical protein
MPPAPVRVPSLAPIITTVMSVANDKVVDEMILGTVHRSPSICLIPEENHGKPQLGGTVRPVVTSMGYLPSK